MRPISNIANTLRNLIEKKDEVDEPSGGFLSYRIRQKAISLVKNNGRLLDIGAGEGLLLKAIGSAASKWIYCLDLEKDWLTLAARRRADTKRNFFVVGDGMQLPFENDIFDEVTLLNLFMNIPDAGVVAFLLKDAMRVCKNRGKIIFDYRNILNPWIFTLYKTVRFHDPQIKLPLRAFTRREMKGVLHSLGIQKGVVYHPIPSWWRVNPPVYLVEVKKGGRG
jgi:ubiquinone/menaquinone biosynthesis C-methylase UbiE